MKIELNEHAKSVAFGIIFLILNISEFIAVGRNTYTFWLFVGYGLYKIGNKKTK